MRDSNERAWRRLGEMQNPERLFNLRMEPQGNPPGVYLERIESILSQIERDCNNKCAVLETELDGFCGLLKESIKKGRKLQEAMEERAIASSDNELTFSEESLDTREDS